MLIFISNTCILRESTMCDFCAPIVGRGGLWHTEKDCAVKQSAHCPLCGPGTHFKSMCPKRRKPMSPHAKPIASSKPPCNPPHMFMSDSNQGYCEYLRQNGLDIERKQSDNRSAVQQHLLSQDPPLLLVNPPAMIPVYSPEITHCKQMHGGNVHCNSTASNGTATQTRKKLKLIIE